jgi:hypothetical protein
MSNDDEGVKGVKGEKPPAITKTWEKELQLRFEILQIQHEEAQALHAEFPERSKRIEAVEAARLADYQSSIKYRQLVAEVFALQTGIMEREVAALERIADALSTGIVYRKM